RAEPTFVDWAVRVAFDLQKLHRAIRFLARVCDQRAADRAVRTDGMCLCRSCDMQLLLDFGRASEIEAQFGDDKHARGTDAREFEEFLTGHDRHRDSSDRAAKAEKRILLLQRFLNVLPR